MSNPRDWFRRRREPSSLSEADDSFADGPILDLGRSATLVVDDPEPALQVGAAQAQPAAANPIALAMVARPAAAGERSTGERHAGERSGSVPPPPPRPAASLREAKIIEPSAFAVRPELARPELAVVKPANAADGAPPKPAATASAGPPDEPKPAANVAAFRLRGKAVPLNRPPGQTMRAPVPESRRAAPARPEPRAPFQAPRPEPPRHEPPRRESPRDGAPVGDMPGFTLAAPGSAWMRGSAALKDSGTMNAVLREAFTPTRPKQQASLFSGRYREMQRIIAAIEEERAHIVLYGERGSGKTSLANVVAAKAEEAGYFVLRSACSSELSFDDIFRGFLRRLPAAFLEGGIGATTRAGVQNFDELLPAGEIGVPELIQSFERLHDKHVILIVDEYDRVTDESTKNKLAELIKNMSDASAPVTLLLIGVAENVDELLGRHPSLQRTLVTMPLPLMMPREIAGIIESGERKSGLRFDPAVRETIVELAQGLPYHAQLLCLFAARSAVRRHSQRVEREDLRYATQRATEEAEGRIKEMYNLALGTQPGTAFKDALFAAARAASDEFGTFTVGDVAAAAATLGDQPASTLALQYPLKKLADAERGAVLRRISTPDGLRYQFYNQRMRHYVLIRQAEERGLI